MISMSPSAHGERSLESVKDLVSLLRLRAAVQSDETAYIFLEDGETERARLTFWELDLRAKSIAAELQHMGLEDQIALLLYPPGLDYIEAFFGCLYAGVVAVPAYPPSGRHLQRLQAIVSDAKPAVIMTISSLHERFVAEEKAEAGIGRQRWCLTDGINSDGADWRPVAAEPCRLAFLQYTSGSTGDPRGVMVSHGNLIANQALIKESFGHSERSTLVGWLPLYHDMGLIGNILQPLYVGAKAVLMSPMAFLEKPIRWLRAISDYRAHTSGGPNFGFEHCIRRITESEKSGLDLTSWRIAFSGAEPVRAATLDRFAAAFAESGFRRDRFVPCYGLAEATLVVTAPTPGRAGTLRRIDRRDVERNRATTVDSGEEAVSVIGCGRAWPGHEVVVVDPDTATRRADNEVGEIWVAGASVAQGYWNRPEKTATTFGARLADDPTQRFMRTGDLGFLDAGELFVTGRAKDIVIIAGRNYYPQDFECVIDDEVAEARTGCSAAFSIVVNEQEAFVLLVEPQRSQLPSLRLGGAEALFHKIRECLARTSDIAPLEIVLVQPGSVPKTSSGKIRRSACRRSYLDDALQVVAREGTQDEEARGEQTTATDDTGATALLRDTLPLLTPPQKAALISRFIISTAARLLRIPASDLVADWPIIRVGLDSLRSVELKHALDEMLGTDVPLSLLMSEKTFTQIANELGAEEGLGSSETTAVADEDVGALSHTERAIWAVHQLEPSGVAYNLHLALGFEGRIDYRALEKALGDVFERHSILSSAYAVDGEGVVRSAQPNPGWFASVDATGWTSESLQSDMGRRAATPFDLGTGEVFRASLYRRGEERATLLLCAHHIALDLWSLLILLSELQKVYVARCSGRKAALRRPVADYAEFVSWQRRYLRSDSCERAWIYWRERLGGDLPVLALPIDHPRPSEPSYVGSSVRINVGGQLAAALRKFARERGVTLFSLLLSAYKIVLYRHTHRSDIVVGTAGSGRSRERFRGVVGNFVNPLALRTRVEPSMRFSEYLRDVQGRVLEALEHQDFPFSELVERLEPERVVGQWPIFQTWFALQQAQSDVEGDFAEFALGEETASTPWGDGAIRGEAVTTRVERFDLKLMAAATRRGLVLSFQYRLDLFERTTIERFA
ncbi:MAG: non-ribosomal peptide synthetase, partial [Methylocystaceae bacterium]